MVSCARLLLVAMGLPFQAFAQETADSSAIPSLLAARVAGAVADMWSVPPTSVELEWGRVVGESGSLTNDAEFRLLPGTGASFVVDIRRSDGTPLAVRLRAGILDTVAVASRPLVAGTTLQDGDVMHEERTRWGAPEESADPMPTAGWVVRRTVAVGAVLEDPLVQPPLLVRPGSRVTLVWQRERVSVSIEGSAINGGAMGEEVRVRLDNERGRARGVVTGPGVARLVARGDR